MTSVNRKNGCDGYFVAAVSKLMYLSSFRSVDRIQHAQNRGDVDVGVDTDTEDVFSVRFFQLDIGDSLCVGAFRNRVSKPTFFSALKNASIGPLPVPCSLTSLVPSMSSLPLKCT